MDINQEILVHPEGIQPSAVNDTLRRTTRIRRPTEKVRIIRPDVLPEGPGPLEEEPATGEPPTDAETTPAQLRLLLHIPELFRTMANTFGLTRLYFGCPSAVPDMDVGIESFVADHVGDPDPILSKSVADIIYPYPNLHAFNLNRWFWGKAGKSRDDRRDLIQKVIGAPGFKPEEVMGVNFEKLDEEVAKDHNSCLEGNGWEQSSITIEVLIGQKATKKSKQKKAAAHRSAQLHDKIDLEAHEWQTKRFVVPNFHHRKLTHVMCAAIENFPQAKQFHWHPYETLWQPPWPNAPPERVYDELYSGSAFLGADRCHELKRLAIIHGQIIHDMTRLIIWWFSFRNRQG
jgi:hypothetical protein